MRVKWDDACEVNTLLLPGSVGHGATAVVEGLLLLLPSLSLTR